MLFISKLDGKLSCSEHDPCGPDPLEPGEIREYVPGTNSARPGSMAVPVTMVHESGRASFSSVQAAPTEQGPPPRLYINTKTATSSFIPFNRSYLTDRTEGKAFPTVTPAKGEREEGEVEDGEMCRLEVDDMEDAEEEEEEDDEDDDDDDEEDEMEEMEIVEDEEDEPVYGGDLLEEDDGEDSDGGHVYDTWNDYGEDEDGMVEGEEWVRIEDEDK